MHALVVALACVMGCAAETDEDDLADTAEDEAALSANVRVETHFSRPMRAPDVDMTILDHIIRLVDDTPRGESLQIAIHSIASNKVQRALVRAKKRGVKIQVAHNGENIKGDDDSPRELAEALGASHRFCGKVVRGGKGGGCISDHPSSLMHSKLALFSKTKDDTGATRENVTWFGSANLTNATGAKSYNNTVTVYGDKALYERFTKRYFAKLWSQDHAKDLPSFGSGASGTTVWASPDSDVDLWIQRLNAIDPDDRCEVRVAQSMIHDSRLDLVEKLATLKKGKCKIWVAANHIEPKARAVLDRANIPLSRPKTHDKLVLVEAKFGDKGRKKTVFTGSHNWTYSANYINDELLVRIDNPAVYGPFLAHFNRQFDDGK